MWLLQDMNSIAQSDPDVNGSPVRRSGASDAPATGRALLSGATEHSAESSFSSALQAANARLLRRRAMRPAISPAAGPAEILSQAATAAMLPAHLSWGSAQMRRVSPPPCLSADLPPLRIVQQPRAEAPPANAAPEPARPGLRAYPSLLTAFLQTGQAAVGRVWLLGRYLDRAGQGWLSVATVRAQLTGGELRLCGWRRLRQLLRAGEGVFWQRDGRDRLWFYGAARLAAHLGVTRLVGRPISLPLDVVIGDIARWRAHCYTAFHSGRVRGAEPYGAPISRASLARLTQVPARTQRHYERLTRLKRRSNLAVGGLAGADARQEHAWRYGRAHFILVDAHGRQGAAGVAYLAHRLPNQYAAGHADQPIGRRRKINRWLRCRAARRPADVSSDLVKTRERGNRSQTQPSNTRPSPRLPVYCRHARAALHHLKQGAADSYWPTTLRTRQGGGIWHVLTRGEEDCPEKICRA